MVGASIVSALNTVPFSNSPSLKLGNWLYVGGSGPGNYSKIQDAIYNSSPGDTIYVYNGTYYETLFINVTNLTLIGDGRDVTVINANSTTAVYIQQSFVSIQGFRIIAYENFTYDNGIYVANGLQNVKICNNNLSKNSRGINIDGRNNYDVVENNVFYSNFYGIVFYNDDQCIIRDNKFVGDTNGLVLYGVENEILNNSFIGCDLEGIDQIAGGLSTFRDNIFIGNDIGLSVCGTYDIIENHFENNGLGLGLYYGSDSVVNQNNFIDNYKDATFSEMSPLHGNNWDGNYWGISFYPFGCKIIFGCVKTRIPRIIQIDPGETTYYWISWVNLDRNPAKEPYDVPGMS